MLKGLNIEQSRVANQNIIGGHMAGTNRRLIPEGLQRVIINLLTPLTK